MRIPEDAVREVVAATDLVDLIGRVVPLKRSGQNFTGLCPFHREKTASFNVSPDRQIWKCFGCGVGGDAITFLMEHDKLSFPEAVQLLADRSGVALPEAERGAHDEGPRRVDVLGALERAAAWFQRKLQSDAGRAALAYCDHRAIDQQARDDFGLGYAPADGQALVRALADAGVPLDVATTAGLLRISDRDGRPYAYFRDRLIFPIHDAQGRVVGFGGRVLSGDDQGPKYLNSPESPVFNKRRLLYGITHARGDERDAPLLVMEGYTDVIVARRYGLQGPVATLGTALTPDHLRVLRRFGRDIVIVFDGDAAGLNAAERTAELALTEDCEISLVALPQGVDPADLVQQEGPGAFTTLLGGRREAAAFRVDRLRQEFDLRSDSGRTQAGRVVTDLLGRVPNPIAQDLLARRAAEVLDVSEEALRRGAGDRRPAARAPGRDAGPASTAPMAAAEPRTLDSGALAELDCVVAVLGEPSLAGSAGEWVPMEWVRDARCRALFDRVLAIAAAGGVPQPHDLLAAFPDEGYRPYLQRLTDLSPSQPPRRLLAAARQALELRELDEARVAWTRAVGDAEARADRGAQDEAMRELAAVIQRRAEVAQSADLPDEVAR